MKKSELTPKQQEVLMQQVRIAVIMDQTVIDPPPRGVLVLWEKMAEAGELDEFDVKRMEELLGIR